MLTLKDNIGTKRTKTNQLNHVNNSRHKVSEGYLFQKSIYLVSKRLFEFRINYLVDDTLDKNPFPGYVLKNKELFPAKHLIHKKA